MVSSSSFVSLYIHVLVAVLLHDLLIMEFSRFTSICCSIAEPVYVLQVHTVPVYSEYGTHYVLERLVISLSVSLSRKNCRHSIMSCPDIVTEGSPGRAVVQMVASSVPCNLRRSILFDFFFFCPIPASLSSPFLIILLLSLF